MSLEEESAILFSKDIPHFRKNAFGRKVSHITQQRVREILHYSEVSGEFIWLCSPASNIPKGAVAGYKNNQGHIVIRIDNVIYTASSLAFLYMLGYIPKEIDHKNNISSDNSWSNLRAATKSQNQQNKLLQKNNTSGIKGVSWHKRAGKWRGVIKKNGISYQTGYFETVEEAAQATRKLRIKLHGEYANHG